MKRHLLALGVLYCVFGILFLIVGLFFAMAVYTEFIGVITSGAVLLAIIAIVLPILSILSGYYCLCDRKTWSRIFSLYTSYLILVWIPFGTIIGIYGIWVLYKRETKEMFGSEKSQVQK
ncbi:MAG: hypothetical protein WBB84_00315 [Candidatus Omnitrophota bacterium]